jgi:hypothetical protein
MNSSYSEIRKKPSRNILSKTTKLISNVPILNRGFNEQVPSSARWLLRTNYLSDDQKLKAIKFMDPESGKNLQQFLDKSNEFLDVTDKIGNFHKSLIEKTPSSKKAYDNFRNNDLFGGKYKKNKKTKKYKRKNKTRKNKRK